MPCPTLSEEVQDVICEFVPCIDTLQSLCLVSRSWLPAARRALYHAPLLDRPITWRAAHALVDAVEANPVLGRLVRKLPELDRWARTLEPRNEGGWDWGLAVLESCPYVKDLGTSVSTDEQVELLAPVLAGLSPTLHHLSIGHGRGSLSLARLHALLTTSELSRLSTLTLGSFRNFEFQPPIIPPALIRVDALTLSSGYPFPLDSLLKHLPLHPILTCFTLTISNLPDPTALLTLLTLLSPTLAHLKIDLTAVHFRRRGLGTYAKTHNGPLLSLPLFSLLPHLRTLHLSYFRRMSIARLRALAAHSPSLESLEMRCTPWVADAGGAVFDAGEVRRILGSFGRMEKVWLGWLPIEHGREYAELDEMEGEGVEVGYETCGVVCHACGDFHDEEA